MYQLILFMIVILFEFVLGVYLQIKLIRKVKNEKAVTWEIEIYHSVVLIIHFTLSLSVRTLVYIFPDLSHYTGFWWFCEVYRAIKIWGIYAISLHSFSVSVHKYVVIFYWKVNSCVLRKLEILVFGIFLSLPILWSAGLMARFSSSSHFSVAIIPEVWRNLRNHSTEPKPDFVDSYLFCNFNQTNSKDYAGDFIYFMTEFYCVGQSLITLAININIIEAFLYFNIFRFASRYIYIGTFYHLVFLNNVYRVN